MSITSVINDTVTSVSLVNAQKPLPPTISGYSVGGLDDTALDPAGGQTVQINGTGFLPGATITFDGSAVAVVTFSSANRLTFTSPAKSAGTYTIYVVNPDGGTAIYIPGVIYSLLPTWTTGAGTLGSYYETQSISNTVVASGDAPITYSLYSGSLPTGSTLSSGGVITGTAPVDNSSTTYSFTIEAIDAQLQSSTRSFSLTINTDVVTWVSPANATTYTSAVDSAIANVTLSATDAAGYAVTYTANALPTGLSLSGANISGTPTVIADSSTLLTATAATTNRTATRTINWSITVANDPYFEYNTLLIPGASTTFVDDASTNNFAVTINGDTKPNNFNPYTPGYYSNYMNSSSNFLSIPSQVTASQLGAGDFTIEAWVYFNTSSAGYQDIVGRVQNNIAGSWNFGYYNGKLVWTNWTTYLATGATTITTNNWHHVAVSRSGTTLKLFLDGVLDATVTNSVDYTCAQALTIGYCYNATLNGYLSNLRIVKGTAVYTSNFTPSTTPLTAISGTLLLTCQSNRFIDNSTNAFTITVNGSPTINSFDPFTPNSSYSSYGSGYFDGTGDYLTVPSSSAFTFGTGDFTVEGWVYVTAHNGAGANGIFQQGTTSFPLSTTNSVAFGTFSSGQVWQIYANNTNTNSSATWNFNTWYHFAVVRSSSTTKLYINGVAVITVASDSTNYTGTYFGIGSIYGTGYSQLGYISDVRVVKGTAVYTSTFTPPTAPLTAIANTSLLTLQNNQSVNNSVFLDNSSNNFLVTRAGNATQGTFSPYGGNWSNYFDGTGDNLSLATATALGTGNTTVEFWFFPTDSSATYRGIYDGRSTVNTDTGYAIFQYGLTIEVYGSGLKVATSASAFTVNKWIHVALVRTSGTCQLYINGVASGSSGTYSSNLTSTVRKIGDSVNTLYPFVGYISNLREVTSALYSGTFTPSTTPLTPITNTSLLTCQSNRLIDNSINNFTITKYGDTSVQRFSPFNPSLVTPTSYSGYFDGTGDYLNLPSSTVLPGAGDFTIEFWINIPTAPTGGAYMTPFAYGSSGSVLRCFVLDDSGTKLGIWIGASNILIVATTAMIGQWAHIALSRASSTLTTYINGTSVSAVTNSTNFNTGQLYIASQAAGFLVTGYISNFRVVVGTAVYTSNFTPSTTPLTAISGTSLLTLQSTTFIDNSTNNLTITANGNSQPSIQNPFGYTSATTNGYSVSTIGGSGYFDGTGDYLTLAANSLLTITAGPSFTMEAWIYPVTNSESTPMIASQDYGGGDNQCFQFRYNTSNNTLQFTYWTSSSRTSAVGAVTTNTITLNQWNHVAVSWTGTTLYLFINGVVGFSGAVSTIYGATNNPTSIGIMSTGNLTAYFKGYISDLRMIKGQALYTSNFVPPSAPLTAIQNTSLLTNMTSAGIYDAAMMNDMESVGDAKLSTAVSKFGGSSMYFDGTGDYLTFPSNPQYAFGTGNFTIEGWLYLTGNQNFGPIFISSTTGAGNALHIQINNANKVRVTNETTEFLLATNAISLSTWTHIAVVRSGTTLSIYQNGTLNGSTTNSTDFIQNGALVGLEPTGGSFYYAGYIDDLRITKGYARYTTNFTAPTSAFPIY